MKTSLQTREVSSEFVRNLELISSNIFPLPGATFNKGNHSDPRIKLLPSTIEKGNDKITLYEHVATIRDKKTDTFYVAFRQTMDCLFLEQKDLNKFPEWLMKSQVKTTELSVHIYQVIERNGKHVFPKDIPTLRTHEDWLKPITDEAIFEAVAHFLLKQPAVNIEMFKKI